MSVDTFGFSLPSIVQPAQRAGIDGFLVVCDSLLQLLDVQVGDCGISSFSACDAVWSLLYSGMLC